MMTLENNKNIARRYFEDAPQNPEVCDEIFAPNVCFFTFQRSFVIPQVIKSTPHNEKATYEWLKTVWSADWHFTVDEVIAEDDRVVVLWTFYGKQQGDFYGLPPTNKEAFYSGINIFHIKEGKIVEIWDIYDRLWLWQQLGVLPDIRDAIASAVKANSAESSNPFP